MWHEHVPRDGGERIINELTALVPSTMRSRWVLHRQNIITVGAIRLHCGEVFFSLVCTPCFQVARPCCMPFLFSSRLHRPCPCTNLYHCFPRGCTLRRDALRVGRSHCLPRPFRLRESGGRERRQHHEKMRKAREERNLSQKNKKEDT